MSTLLEIESILFIPVLSITGLEKDAMYIKKTIKEAMISISNSEYHMFSIPLEVNVNSGYNWGEAH